MEGLWNICFTISTRLIDRDIIIIIIIIIAVVVVNNDNNSNKNNNNSRNSNSSSNLNKYLCTKCTDATWSTILNEMLCSGVYPTFS